MNFAGEKKELSRSQSACHLGTSPHLTNMAASFAWLSVIVKQGCRTVLPRKIVKIGWENNFGELMLAADPGLNLAVVEKVSIPRTRNLYCVYTSSLSRYGTVRHNTARKFSQCKRAPNRAVPCRASPAKCGRPARFGTARHGSLT